MIYFVGAGPGDKELLTVKAARLLSQADCIIYAGSLVNPTLLEYARADCEIFDSAAMTLEQVLDVMFAFERKKCDAVIVRLHTGDPSIYGAIREQIDRIAESGIAFEIVPGVSSFAGAAAVLGVEYTLPGVSQTLILSRMAGRTPVPAKESIVALAKIQASLVVFLSGDKLPELAAKLIEGGYAPDTPAAIAYKVTWPDEKIIKTTVACLADDGEKHGIKKMALILVGRFLGDAYERSRLYNPSFSHGFRDANIDANIVANVDGGDDDT